jgi:serine/threonine protein kinase
MIGQKLGSYRIEEELGSGAMGVVYRGIHEVKKWPVAIKVISMEQMGKGNAMDRFEREAKILAQFRHPNIVRYIGEGSSGGKYYYVMSYIKGPTLDKVLSERKQIPWRELVDLGVQLCDALQYSHDHGVVHRDLKPSNLMLTESGQLKLTDFGIAKDLDATALTGTGRTLGTATYMAPEQIRGTPEISHKTDLYSLGAVFYHLLTGSPPFQGQTALVMMHAHINDPPKRPSDKIQEIPKALDDLVITLMAKQPQDRPWDAEAVAQILRGILDKAARQETIQMVWPEPGSPGSMPTRADMIDPTLARKPKSSRKKKAAKSNRANLEVAGLVAALGLIAGVFAYLVWPPSAAYLYRQAETLMASDDRLERTRARDEYLDPLDQRFPNHAYREKTEAWRDQIDLEDAERRAQVFDEIGFSGFKKARGEAEELYREVAKEVEAALKRKDDREAARLWRAMEKQLSRDGRQGRGWALLARSRAEAVEKGINRRRETVERLMAQATIAPQFADSELARNNALKILRDVVDRFADYPDVAEFVTQAKQALAAATATESAPPPAKP